jgi:lysozyme family protein
MLNAGANQFADLAELWERLWRVCEQTEALLNQVRKIRERMQLKRQHPSEIKAGLNGTSSDFASYWAGLGASAT